MAEIVRLKSSDHARCLDVALIHIAEIHLGVLPLLGVGFMARLYRGLAEVPRSGVWAATDGGRTIGFLAGCADTGATYRRVMLRGLIPLGGRMAARLIGSREVRRKVGALVGYARREATAPAGEAAHESGAGSRAELLAIAVAKDFQGHGAGRLLVEAFEDAVREWGVGRYWVSTNQAEVASNRFYQSLGFVPAGTFSHHDLTLQRYSKQVSAGISS